MRGVGDIVNRAVRPVLSVDDRIEVDLEHCLVRRAERRDARALIAHCANVLHLDRPYSCDATRSHDENIDGTNAAGEGLLCLAATD